MRLEPSIRNELSQIVFQMTAREEETYSRARNNISLLSFLVKLNRLYANYKMPANEKDPFSPHLIRVIDYVVNNFEKPITLDEIAAQCYLSKYHLAHEFKRTMGMTVYQYVTTRRVCRARQMLLTGVKPGKAAKLCGFSDYSAFYRAFMKEYGRSPRAV
jgi:AraC-like DNA-binding protein